MLRQHVNVPKNNDKGYEAYQLIEFEPDLLYIRFIRIIRETNLRYRRIYYIQFLRFIRILIRIGENLDLDLKVEYRHLQYQNY